MAMAMIYFAAVAIILASSTALISRQIFYYVD